jgi:uncharacterized protein (DUF302 family)
MYYIVKATKSFEQALADLGRAVKCHEFGVLRVHDLSATLRSKGIALDEEEQCRLFKV